MRRSTSATLVCGLFLLSSLPAAAQSTPNPAMTTPDQVAWQFFIQVNSRASGSNALFETWASDTDTFKPVPQFPTTVTPMVLREPVVPALGRQALHAAELKFEHPVTGRRLEFESPLPDDMAHLVAGLKAIRSR